MSDGRLLVTKLKVIGKSKPILKAKEVDNAPTIDEASSTTLRGVQATQ